MKVQVGPDGDKHLAGKLVSATHHFYHFILFFRLLFSLFCFGTFCTMNLILQNIYLIDPVGEVAEGSSGKFNDVVVRLHHVEVSWLSSKHLNYFLSAQKFFSGRHHIRNDASS